MTSEAVRLDCPACGETWQYSLGMNLVCPGCGVDVLLGGDMFCGAGGSTKGALIAIHELKRPVLFTCVNHWDRAVETHSLNHPYARHFVQDVGVAEPLHLVPEGWLDFLWASPTCTYHSQARGGRPINDQQRMDPWSVVRWLTTLDVRLLLIENVPEFVGWGPLKRDGSKDRSKRGLYFEEWLRVLQGLGYDVQWRMLNAADFGDATTRTRFFLQARKDGAPILWPEPTHAQKPDVMFGNRQRWRGAREIIDWSNQGRSLLDDPRYQAKPLSEKTRRRIARGLERFGGTLAPLFVGLLGLETEAMPEGEPHAFAMGKQSNPAYRDLGPVLVGANRNNNIPRPMDEPIPPATTAAGGGLYMVEPSAEPFVLGQNGGAAARETSEPLPTILTEGAIALVEPLVIPYYRTGVAKPTDEPLDTVTTRGRLGLLSGLVVPYGPSAEARPDGEPLPTVLTKDRLGLLSPFIVPQFGEREGQAPRVHSVDEPLPAVTSHGAGRLVEPIVLQMAPRHGDVNGVRSPDDPLYTVVTNARLGVVNPILVQTDQTGGNGDYVRPLDEPTYAIVTKQNMALCDPCLVQVNDSSDAPHGRVRSTDEPLWTVTTHRNVGLVEGIADRVKAGELDPRRLVIIDDVLYQLDLRFRMLNNRELARAMSFDDDESQYEFAGNVGEVTKQIGNAVPVRTAAALVRAILT